MIADLLTFLWASVCNLFTLLSGIVALLAELLRRYLGWEISNHWYGRIIVAGLMVGMFLAWRDERTEVKKKQDEINQQAQADTGATAKVGELSKNLDELGKRNKQLEDQVASLQKQQEPWVMTANQKKRLIAVLNNVPSGTTYPVRIRFIADCDQCARYAHDLGETWYEILGWEVRATNFYGLSVRTQGVSVAVDMEGCPPDALRLMMQAFDAAEIRYEKAQAEGGLGSGSCAVVVGNKPYERDDFKAK